MKLTKYKELVELEEYVAWKLDPKCPLPQKIPWVGKGDLQVIQKALKQAEQREQKRCLDIVDKCILHGWTLGNCSELIKKPQDG